MLRQTLRSGATGLLSPAASLPVGAAGASERFGGAIAGARWLEALPPDDEWLHVQGVALGRRRIRVTVAELRPESSVVRVEIDAATLRIRRRIRVADHPGCTLGRHRAWSTSRNDNAVE